MRSVPRALVVVSCRRLSSNQELMGIPANANGILEEDEQQSSLRSDCTVDCA